jgi:hypothetical protein
VTDEELLKRYAHPSEVKPGRWWIGLAGFTYSAESLAALIRAQIELGVPVSETFSTEAFVALVQRLVAAEERIAELERSCCSGWSRDVG